MDVPEDYIDYAAEAADLEQMAREGMGEEPEVGELRAPPSLPRRYNMVISTTEYHKLIAARDNIVHPKLRSGVSTRGQSVLMEIIREEFPHADIRMAYSPALQQFVRRFMSGPSADRYGVLQGAIAMASGIQASETRVLNHKGYPSPDAQSPGTETRREWSRWHLLQGHYQRLRQQFQKSGFATEIFEDRGMRIILTASGWAFSTRGSTHAHVAPISALMMCLHSMELQVKTVMACEVTRPDMPQLPGWYRSVIDVQRRIVIRCGETGHDIAKGPEALCKTYASDVSGGHHGHGLSSFEKMASKYRDKAVSQDVLRETEEMIELCRRGTSVDECTEMSGMAATFGYPVIDAEQSGAHARATGSEDDTSAPYAVEEVLLLFQHLVLKNYVRIRSDYPPITFRKQGLKLERLASAKFLDLQDGSYPLEDWRHAEMHDMFEFMYHEDYLSLIADKSTLEPQSLARQFYVGSLSDVSIKRLIAKILNTDDINTRVDVERFACEIWPDEWRRCRLVPKELEHKAMARMFVVLPDMVRRALSIIQENVKELFFPVIPYTSMAMSGQEIAEALHKSTHGQGKYKLELDLSSWNLKFRQFLTRPFGFLMDRMAGVTNLFGGSHRFLAGAEFCVSHRDTWNEALENPAYPDRAVPDGDMLWHNDESGKEGIEQRFWTVITEVMIYRCLYRHQLPFTLLGQGDNQTLVIDMVSIDPARRGVLAAEIEEDIELGTAECNHVCKPVEFLGSFTVLTYSKNFYVNGRLIPQCVKGAARITHGSSDSLESLEDDLGGIASSAYTASLNAPHPLLVRYLGAIHFYAYCLSMRYGLGPYSNEENVEAGKLAQNPLSWILPSVLGGLPTVPLGAYIYRGDPDPLSHAIASIRLAKGLKEVREYMAYLDSPTPYVQQASRRQLILNPYGLPIITARSGATAMQDFTMSYLCGVRNRDVCELANLASAGKSELMDAISSIHPFIPSMVEDMISASVLGRAEKVAKKFSAAGTLLKLAPPETLNIAVMSSLRRVISVNLHFAAAATFSGYDWRERSHDIAERLRLRWNLGPGGIIGASVAQPLDYSIQHTVGPGVCTILRSEYDLSRTGPCPPYLGSKTMERRSSEKYQIEKSPGTVDLAKMVLSMTAGSITPEVEGVYRAILGSRTDLSFDELLEIFPHTSSGTPGHRYESMQGTRSIGPVGNPGPRGWCATDTDNIPGISGSTHDYPIPIQSFMSCTVVSAVCTARMGRVTRIHRIGLSADHYPELPDPSRSSTGSMPPMPPLRNNKLCHIPTITIHRTASRIGMPGVHDISRLGILSALILLHGVCSNNARAAADLGDERLIARVDVAGALACGADAILEAACRACALLFVWHMTWFSEERQWRHDDQVLCDNLASSLALSIYPVITHQAMTGSCLELFGIGRENPGDSGYRAGVDRLRRIISSECRIRARSADACHLAWEKMLFPHSAMGAPPHLLARLQMSVTAWGAFLRSDSHSLGVLKEAIRTTWKRLGEDGPLAQSITTTIGIRQFYAFINNALSESHREPIPYAQSARILNLDMPQAWRRLRRFRPRAQVRDITQQKPAEPIPNPIPAALEEVGTAIVRAPILEPLAFRRRPAYDRAMRVIGLRSTSPALWIPLLKDTSDPVLVVGTGSGGIQWACASLGLRSFGLDKSSIIPPERTARTGWKPCDILHLQSAVLSAAMWDTDGNWYGAAGAEALAEQRFRTVVIDLESKGMRHGPLALNQLALGGYAGRVLWRVFVTQPELNAMVTWLASKGSKPEVFAGSSITPSASESAPVIFRFRYSSSAAPPTAPGIVVSVSPPVYAQPADPTLSLREIIGDLTGGLSFETDMNALEQSLLDNCSVRSVHRGRTDKAQGLMYLRLHAIISTVNRELARESGGQLHWLSDPPPHEAYGPIHVRHDDPHVRYLWEKIVPRLAGCLLLVRDHAQ